MIPVGEGMTVDTESEATKKAQDGFSSSCSSTTRSTARVRQGWRMPVAGSDRGLGSGESRFVEEKRHYEKPIPISDTVYLDRERCILCDRCTRFADDVAGDTLIHFMDRGNSTQVNTFPDEPFASYFSGNTVQICPVGALTAKPYRFKARPWDLEETISTAWIDSVGSRVTVQSSRNQSCACSGRRRQRQLGWLSDKERFGFEALNSEDRLTAPMVRVDGRLEATGWAPALAAATDALRDVDPARIGVIGGARLTNESQYAWTKLAKGVLGTDHVDAQLGDGLAEAVLGLPRATINQACTRAAPSSSSVRPQGRPRGAVLRLRHAVVNDGTTLIELTPTRTGLSTIAAHSLHPKPGEVDLLAAALVDAVSGDACDAAGAGRRHRRCGCCDLGSSHGGPRPGLGRRVRSGHRRCSHRPQPTSKASVSCRRCVAACARALDMGMAPGLLRPSAAERRLRRLRSVPTEVGMDTIAMLEAAASGDLDVLVLLGSDPLSDVPDADLAARASRWAP